MNRAPLKNAAVRCIFLLKMLHLILTPFETDFVPFETPNNFFFCRINCSITFGHRLKRPSCSNLFKPIRTCSNLFKPVRTCLNSIKLVSNQPQNPTNKMLTIPNAYAAKRQSLCCKIPIHKMPRSKTPIFQKIILTAFEANFVPFETSGNFFFCRIYCSITFGANGRVGRRLKRHSCSNLFQLV